MSIYARIQDGEVYEFFETEVDIATIFPPELIWVNVDGIEGIAQGWTATRNGDQWSFAPYVPPPPTPQEVLATQSAILVFLKTEAEAQKTALTNRISTLQDAIDNVGVEGMEDFAATPEEQAEFPKRKAQLTKWKNYAILLGRVTSQAGWPPNVTWPAKPSEGMDLSTASSIAAESQ